ncbi:GNAT family N-acetyltransferase [Streptomyces sp. NBC_01537]|uniref:GNAT family N-acetyltransferase n=1 Tax=Streptomyces sp. NBC_01537 TaxID=2903896 RepID=UPI0038701684
MVTIARTTGGAGSSRCKQGRANVCGLPRCDGWRCHLYRLAVHPGHRRQGIALLDAAEQRFALDEAAHRLTGVRGRSPQRVRAEPATPHDLPFLYHCPTLSPPRKV